MAKRTTYPANRVRRDAVHGRRHRFTGVRRGHLDTTVKPHGCGDGGILDVRTLSGAWGWALLNPMVIQFGGISTTIRSARAR